MVIDPLLLEVGSVIEHAFGSRDLWWARHASNLDFLPNKEIRGEDALRRDGHAAGCRLPGSAVATQGRHVNPGHGTPRFLLVALIDALGRRLAQAPPQRDDLRLLAEDAAQIVRGDDGGAECVIGPSRQDNQRAQSNQPGTRQGQSQHCQAERAD